MNGTYHPCSHPSAEVLNTIPIEDAKKYHIVMRQCFVCSVVYERVERIV